MKKRKELVQGTLKTVRRHYWMLVLVCLIGTVLGIENEENLDIAGLRFGMEQEENLQITGLFVELPEELDRFNNPLLRAINDLWNGNVERPSQDILDQKREELANRKYFGGSAGVFTAAVRVMTSGELLFLIYQEVNGIIGSPNVTTIFLIILAAALYIFIWLFIKEVYVVINRRIVLEARTYDKVPVARFLFPLRVKKWCQTAWTLFVKEGYYLLWCLTIVGGVIKYFSYILVPYVIAENPSLKANEAITLSRNLMKGKKWRLFTLMLTFLGWDLLRVATLGLAGIFFVGPYKAAFLAEFYADVREDAIRCGVPGSERLKDEFLYRHANEALIAYAYRDVLPIINQPCAKVESLKGVRGFLADKFGILLFNTIEEEEYERRRSEQLRVEKWKEEARGEAYPTRMSGLSPEQRRKSIGEIMFYMRNYSVPSLIMIFFALAFIGWVWEVCLHLVMDGEFVNRGVLAGPWLPIYGCGALLALTLLKTLREKPWLEFLASIFMSGIVEYGTSLYLEWTHDGQRWWDYTGYFLNINGRICAEGLLVFGLGCMGIVYFIGPVLDSIFRRVKLKILTPICVVLIVLFSVDMIHSHDYPNTGKGITDYAVTGEEAPGGISQGMP